MEGRRADLFGAGPIDAYFPEVGERGARAAVRRCRVGLPGVPDLPLFNIGFRDLARARRAGL